MVNKKCWLGILAIVLVFGMAVIEVEAQSNKGGEFTLTNIPTEYNNKYAFIEEYDEDDIELRGFESIDLKHDTFKLSRINNGKVTLPMWISRDEKIVSRYSGNHTVGIEIFIYDDDVIGGMATDIIRFSEYKMGNRLLVDNRVSFSNGNATKSYNDKDKN